MRLITLTCRTKTALNFPTRTSSRSFSTLLKDRNPNVISSLLIFRRELSTSTSSYAPHRKTSFLQQNLGYAVAKPISSISSSAAADSVVDWNDTYPNGFDSGREVACSEVEGEVGEAVSIPVRAFFNSTSVDLKSLEAQHKQNFIPSSARMTNNYVVLRFGDLNPELNSSGSSVVGSDCSYMVVFQYGSIVLFNVHDHEVNGYLKIVERYSSGKVEMKKDEYEVREKPTLDTWMQGGLDYIMLQYLNIDGIRIIGSVLGQSIALDYYVSQVDGIVGEFTGINRGMEQTGTFTVEANRLFKLVGKANSNLADVILKLGLFERSDIAWRDAKYAQIWEYLRDEFELTQRFSSLDLKLKFVEHNIRFLQEILQNRKSTFLEWLIIILIGAEILVSVYDIAHRTL